MDIRYQVDLHPVAAPKQQDHRNSGDGHAVVLNQQTLELLSLATSPISMVPFTTSTVSIRMSFHSSALVELRRRSEGRDLRVTAHTLRIAEQCEPEAS